MILSYLLIALLLMGYFYKVTRFKTSNNRSSSPQVFLRKDVLKICSKFTRNHPCRSVISTKLQSNLIEITLRYGCFPANVSEHLFLRTSLEGCFCNNILLFSNIFGFKSVILIPIYIASLCIFYFATVFETSIEFR